MTKFQKMAKRIELLEVAYNAILDRDIWDNYVGEWDEEQVLREDRKEEHEFYQSILKEIEKLI